MRIGVDLGGTKIEGVVMGPASKILARKRVPTPVGNYDLILSTLADLVRSLETEVGGKQLPAGFGTPGSVSPATGLMKGSNSTLLNGRPLMQDLERALGREVRIENDANCLAVSEARDGAAAGAKVVFAVILGTGCGGGIAINGESLTGQNAIAGEWGHNPLPWPRANELPGNRCWCGQWNCLETWLSGTGLANDYAAYTDSTLRGEEIITRAQAGEGAANAILARYEDRVARALAAVINLLDPNVIVLGGGVSNAERLYTNVPKLWERYVFSDRVDTPLVRAMHGDSSGVRGAAWLWPEA
jgi:fructokinase